MKNTMNNKISYLNLYHKITKNLKFREHFLYRLKQRHNMNFYDLFKIIRSFVYHNGTKYCKDSLVVNAIVSNGKYPNSDFLYSRKYDMVIPFDRYSRELETVKYFDTDYYFKHNKRNKY